MNPIFWDHFTLSNSLWCPLAFAQSVNGTTIQGVREAEHLRFSLNMKNSFSVTVLL